MFIRPAHFFRFALVAISLALLAPESFARKPRQPCAESLALAERAKQRPIREALYSEFLKNDYPEKARSTILAAVEALRELPKSDRLSYLRRRGNQLLSLIKERYGVERVGFHFNHHGGDGEAFVRSGGILASRGDISNNYISFGQNLDYSVYMFASPQENPADILNEPNSDGGLLNLFFPGRMGWALNVFAIDSPTLNLLRENGSIIRHEGAAMVFSESWLKKTGMIGIPYQSYLFPPVDLFSGRLKKRYPELGRLSRDEETLMALVLMEEIIRDGKNWIGPNWDFSDSIEASAIERTSVDSNLAGTSLITP